MGMGEFIPFTKGFAVIACVIRVLLPIWVGIKCVLWVLRKLGDLQDSQVAKEVKKYGEYEP
jgi:hypothetical protein